MINKSYLFTVYNKARSAAKTGKLDLKRVNKALGILQTPDYYTGDKAEYGPSIHSCGCPDYKVRRVTCKHMISEMIKYRIDELVQANLDEFAAVMNEYLKAALERLR